MRVKAFTLLELLVVMALAAIVVAMVWAVYANMNLFAMEHRKRLADSNRMVELDQYLRYDAVRADDVILLDNQACFQRQHWVGEACYTFAADHIVREWQLARDTFMVGVRAWKTDSVDGTRRLHLELVNDQPAAGERLVYPVQLPVTARAE